MKNRPLYSFITTWSNPYKISIK